MEPSGIESNLSSRKDWDVLDAYFDRTAVFQQ